MSYKPDKWRIVKFSHEGEAVYKLFGMWSGGYLDSDSWRMNSGIVGYEEGEGVVQFFGHSGSTYICWLGSEGVTGYGASILSSTDLEAISYKQFKEEWNGR